MEKPPRKASLKGTSPAAPIVENIWKSVLNVSEPCFWRTLSLLWPSGIWHSSLAGAHERFQPARTLITTILMRHKLISLINEGVWGKSTIYPSTTAHSDGWDRFCIHGIRLYIFRPEIKPQLGARSSRTGESLKRGF